MNRPANLILPAITAFFLVLPLTPGKPGLPVNLKADESAYYLMALSLIHDRDLRLEIEDVGRVFLEFPYLPVRNLVVMSDDGWQTVFYGKPLLYPLFAAPLAALFGANGLVFFNMILLLGMIWLGSFYLRRFNSAALSMLFSAGFFFLSAAFTYVFWLQSEIFNMAAVMAACFLAFSPTGKSSTQLPWRPLLSGAALGLAVYNKPMFLLLGVALAWAVVRGRRRNAVAWIGGLLLCLAFAASLSWTLTGKLSPYLGTQQRTGVTVCEPDTMPIEPRGETGGAGQTAAAAAAVSRTGNTWSWLYRLPQLDGRAFWESLRYFLWGRHTGFFLYLPFGGLAILLLALEAPRDSSRWLLLATLAGIVLFFLLWMPVNWQGGGGFVGNRYFINGYPAFLFLVRKVRPPTLVLPFYGLAGLFLGPLLLSPFGTKGPEPTLQAHVRNAPFRFFPIEWSLRHLPGYHNQRFGDLRYLVRKDQGLPRDGGRLWLRGADRVEVWFESQRKLGPVVFEIENFALRNAVDMRFGKARKKLDFATGHERARVTLEPGRPSQIRSRGGDETRIYRLVLESSNGAVRHWTRFFPEAPCSYFAYNESFEESFFVGAGLTFLGEAEELERDIFALEWDRIEVPETVVAGETFKIETRLRNDSSYAWETHFAAQISLSYHWLDEDGKGVVRDGRRTPLPESVAAGSRVEVEQEIEAPSTPGLYLLELDPVYEHVAWFSERNGGNTYRRQVRVLPAPPL